MTQKCDSCQLMMIQGVVCHEKGCPDAWKTETRKCDWCGSYFTPTDRLNFFCSNSCRAAYHDEPDEEVEDTERDETYLVREAELALEGDAPTCLECGSRFVPDRPDHRTCSADCSEEYSYGSGADV